MSGNIDEVFMVNETKVKWMTKAAMVKKKEERGMIITSRFYGDDYVSFQVIKAVLGVSFGFVLVVVLWFMENSEALLTACSVEELFLILKSMWILYLMLVLATILISVLVYTSRFWRARDHAREYTSSLKKIQKIYQKEEKNGKADRK